MSSRISKSFVLVCVLSAYFLGNCAKRIDFKEADREALARSLCPDVQNDLNQCEEDLKQCNADLLQVIH